MYVFTITNATEVSFSHYLSPYLSLSLYLSLCLSVSRCFSFLTHLLLLLLPLSCLLFPIFLSLSLALPFTPCLYLLFRSLQMNFHFEKFKCSSYPFPSLPLFFFLSLSLFLSIVPNKSYRLSLTCWITPLNPMI